MPGNGLFERDEELGLLTARLDAARSGGGGVAVVHGAAGLGKTSLLAALRAHAAAAGGVAVLHTGCAELDRSVGFGVLRRLLTRPLRELDAAGRDSLLAGPSSPIAQVLGLRERRGPIDVAAAAEGLVWLVEGLAEREPLLILVDDAHWADPDSARALAHLARLAGELPALLVLALRPHEASASLFTAVLQDPAVLALGIAPLSPDGVRAVVRGRLDGAPDQLVDACAEVTGGNPFLLREVLADVAATGDGSTLAAARRVRGLAPDAIAQSVLARLERLVAGARRLAAAAAVDPGAPLRRLAALADLDASAAGVAADQLAAAQVLAPGRPPDFLHPVLRTAVYRQLSDTDRSQLHARAAQLLLDESGDPLAIAAHLMRTEPAARPETATALLDAAREELGLGAAEAAAGMLQRALAEPPPAAERAAVLHALGHAEHHLGRASALDRFRAAIDRAADPPHRAQIASDLAAALLLAERPDQAVEVLQHALDGLPTDHDQRFRLLAQLGTVGRYGTGPAAETLRAVTDGLAGDSPGRRALLLVAAWSRDDEPGMTAALLSAELDRALVDPALAAQEWTSANLILSAAATLRTCERIGDADALLAHAADAAIQRGDTPTLAAILAQRGTMLRRLGRLAEAEQQGFAAVNAADRCEASDFIVRFATGCLASTLVDAGRPTEALALCGGLPPEPEGTPGATNVLEARAAARHALGDADAAIAGLRDLAARARPHSTNPANIPVVTELAIVLALAGEREEALTLATAELAAAEAFAAPAAIGRARIALGLAQGGEAGLAELAASAELLATTEFALDHARALFHHGAALRRAGLRVAARDRLHEAGRLATELGAGLLAALVAEELRAAGGRVRKRSASSDGAAGLSAAERRVTELAATGATNKEIAQRLFLTVKTVESHLRNAFRKLDVTSRRDLGAALSTENDGRPRA